MTEEQKKAEKPKYKVIVAGNTLLVRVPFFENKLIACYMDNRGGLFVFHDDFLTSIRDDKTILKG
jgi:hypothetical protein